MKVCTFCHELKPLDQFRKTKTARHKDGLTYYCVPCIRRTNRGWAKRKFLRSVGVTDFEYSQKLVVQDNRCGICGAVSASPRSACDWMTDHDHTTGKFRGILCINCNLKLGWYEQHRSTVNSYLERSAA